jgi:hypothetical protein
VPSCSWNKGIGKKQVLLFSARAGAIGFGVDDHEPFVLGGVQSSNGAVAKICNSALLTDKG